ncbi:MAG TPA: hypothetical protein VJ801_05825 [Polyangia bacterium]|nr:hypothetical protein [Polyangia bacterium]
MSRKSLAILIASSGLLVVSAAHAQSDDKLLAEAAEQGPSKLTPPIAPPTVAESAEQRSQALTPPIAPPTQPTISPTPVNPWFVRSPFVLTAGAGSDWKLTIYGFAEADFMLDSTRSFNDSLNNGVVAHTQTQAGDKRRVQATIRNSRLGFKVETPALQGIRSSVVLEFDLFGNQPSINSGGGSPGQPSGPGATTEAAYFNNAALRVRHGYFKIEDDFVDVLVGQTYYLLGWQNYFFGASCGFAGLPNELFNRTVQLRLSHTFASNPMNFEIAAGAFRPVQRDSVLPDGQGGLRLAINHWKGITTPGSGGTGALAASLGVSGLVRSFMVDPHAPLPAPQIPLIGWALAVDALIPIIPAKDSTDRGNALTLTGEFVTGTGDADQYTGMTAGANMPNVYPLPDLTPVSASGAATPQPATGAAPLVGAPYTPNVDPGLVGFDWNDRVHTINWRTFIVGIQYYLPPRGRIFISGNYSQGKSSNIANYYHPDSPTQPWVNSMAVFQSSRYVDGNIFFDVTRAIRTGFSYQRVDQNLADGTSAHNNRFELTFLHFL